MKKIIKTIAVLALVLSLTAVACTAETGSARPVRVAALKGPTGMAVAHMMKQNEGAYEFIIESQPANVNALIISTRAWRDQGGYPFESKKMFEFKNYTKLY